MKIIRIILQVLILYVFFIIGEALQHLFHLPISGSIVGLVLLLICFALRIVPVAIIEDGAGFLLSFLPLLFIPAMTGVMNYPSLVSLNGLMLLITFVLSTIFTIIAAGSASQVLEKRANKRKEKKKCSKHVSQSL
ncbi:CidA/LrgA family holin-like protein [Bacillus mojavensis]|uniref:CidA/LrgA family protein n=1 Tax=Bacillus mojavensis TaxID=72360 RepID=UPI002DB98B4F|nr:CidA/LrgA family holin-like protein [Bacillus mojavensis]MEC1681493.1 CidA/LrgA family holin-like protein [Bacillus mojavensis]MEC1711581.1 CidA/LrgA family holin-like protein [Bacillus mojavensis]